MAGKVRKARAKKAVARAVQKIEPEEAKAILEEQTEVAEGKVVEAKKKAPGQTVDGVKVSWTKKDIEERFPIVELNSEETIRINWNGVEYQLLQGATHYVPSVIRDVYLQHRKALRTGGKSLPEGGGFSHTIELGAGALPPEF